MSKPVILMVYGDSLSLPRAFEGIQCYHTYPELIRQWYIKSRPESEVYLYNRSQGGGNIELLYKEFQRDCDYFGNSDEKVMILQCGIVDCAPRTIPMWLRAQISKVPGPQRAPITNFLHNNRSKMLNLGLVWRATPPEKFRRLYKNFLSQASKEFSRVYIFNILPTTENIEKHSPGLGASIKRYNRIIGEVVASVRADNIRLLDIHEFAAGGKTKEGDFVNVKDGHHISPVGHKVFYDMFVEGEKKLVAKR